MVTVVLFLAIGNNQGVGRTTVGNKYARIFTLKLRGRTGWTKLGEREFDFVPCFHSTAIIRPTGAVREHIARFTPRLSVRNNSPSGIDRLIMTRA